jgi:hypothetical protein
LFSSAEGFRTTFQPQANRTERVREQTMARDALLVAHTISAEELKRDNQYVLSSGGVAPSRRIVPRNGMRPRAMHLELSGLIRLQSRLSFCYQTLFDHPTTSTLGMRVAFIDHAYALEVTITIM